ncbi:MAG: bifunctional diguanylate cyclase/phosphodiesterase [Acidimicrobiales bacterium]|nr:bifunctional diguanylate cyclase/phosphodiesterase [Acidimicrobiales bacterium]
MARPALPRSGSPLRLFLVFAAVTLVPVLVLGLVLAASYRTEAQRRGLAEGRSEAALIARTAVQPLLDGRPLSEGLTATETADLTRLAAGAVASGDVRRLRLRNLDGQVVFSDDGSGFNEQPEDEALDAARGATVSRLTRLNTDSDDSGPAGSESVEVYLPLAAGSPARQIGVLEVYIPYGPIATDVQSGLATLYRNLVIGLALLYLVLFGIALVVGRRLRQQARVTTYLAEHDALTELPNRVLFHKRVQAELDRARRRDSPTAVAILDLDRFKEVKDTLGHHNGDRLLAAVGSRMAAHLRGTDALARLGGDEFGVVLADVGDADEILQRLREVIQHEVTISGFPLSVEASVGYAVAPADADDADDLLQLADVAMYRAKQRHTGVARYDPSQNRHDAGNLALIADLRGAIESDQLLLHYQPKLRLADGRVTSIEALVRWRHPVRGLVPPDRFIPLAEQSELIDGVTAWVVGRAVRDLDRIDAGSPSRISTAVNISARNLVHPGFGDELLSAVAAGGLAFDRLSVEITETALMTDPEGAGLILRALSDSGIRVSIDDFGCGQTSLAYLSSLPIHELKIDRSFVSDMATDDAHAAIVRSVVELGHNLGFEVVAEGIETAAALSLLRETGCDLGQGFYFAPPMPLEELVPWLRAADEPAVRRLARS